MAAGREPCKNSSVCLFFPVGTSENSGEGVAEALDVIVLSLVRLGIQVLLGPQHAMWSCLLRADLEVCPVTQTGKRQH